jgi:L-ribulose-5-phosphate 4-epimerase
MSEGYIKFDSDWIKDKPLDENKLTKLIEWRQRLHRLKLIGIYPNGWGYGNVSSRVKDTTQFIISGSSTGGLKELTNEHFTLVTKVEIDKNFLTCKGPIIASAESFTHAAIYQASKEAKAVIHFHNKQMWKDLMDKVPTTKKDVPYGSPEMFEEIFRLFKETDVAEKKIICMAGHEEGLIVFGKDLDEAGEVLLRYFNEKK